MCFFACVCVCVWLCLMCVYRGHLVRRVSSDKRAFACRAIWKVVNYKARWWNRWLNNLLKLGAVSRVHAQQLRELLRFVFHRWLKTIICFYLDLAPLYSIVQTEISQYLYKIVILIKYNNNNNISLVSKTIEPLNYCNDIFYIYSPTGWSVITLVNPSMVNVSMTVDTFLQYAIWLNDL